jgi:hypothetical protein
MLGDNVVQHDDPPMLELQTRLGKIDSVRPQNQNKPNKLAIRAH